MDREPEINYFLSKTILKGSAIIHAVAAKIRNPLKFDIIFGKVRKKLGGTLDCRMLEPVIQPMFFFLSGIPFGTDRIR